MSLSKSEKGEAVGQWLTKELTAQACNGNTYPLCFSISISISIDCMKCLAELCGENDFDAFLQAR